MQVSEGGRVAEPSVSYYVEGPHSLCMCRSCCVTAYIALSEDLASIPSLLFFLLSNVQPQLERETSCSLCAREILQVT